MYRRGWILLSDVCFASHLSFSCLVAVLPQVQRALSYETRAGNKKCASGWSSSLKNQTPYSVFKEGHLVLCLKSLCVVKRWRALQVCWEQLVNPWSSDFCTWISTSGWQLFIRWRDGDFGKVSAAGLNWAKEKYQVPFLFLLIGCF